MFKKLFAVNHLVKNKRGFCLKANAKGPFYTRHTDGTFENRSTYYGSVGGLLRDPNERVVFGFSKFLPNEDLKSPYFHYWGSDPDISGNCHVMELSALLVGVTETSKLGLSIIKVFTDRKGIIDAFDMIETGKGKDYKHRAVYDNILGFKNIITNLSFYYIPREHNQLAHQLAKDAVDFHHQVVFKDIVPDNFTDLHSLLEKEKRDRQGVEVSIFFSKCPPFQ